MKKTAVASTVQITYSANGANTKSSANTKRTAPTREAVLNCLAKNLEAIKAFDIHSLSLFGSVARNEATPQSDLDFLVEFKNPATFDGYMDLKFFLEDLFERSVDLVIKDDLKARIRQSVIEESIRVA
ncbi:MAG: nucleotidyltransferase family protein [Phormidesmis sp.]